MHPDEKSIYQMEHIKNEFKKDVKDMGTKKEALDDSINKFIAHIDILDETTKLLEASIEQKITTLVSRAFQSQEDVIGRTLSEKSKACLHSLQEEADFLMKNLKTLRIASRWRQIVVVASFCAGCLLTGVSVVYFVPHKHTYNYNVDSNIAHEAKMGQLLLKAMNKMDDKERKKYMTILAKEME